MNIFKLRTTDTEFFALSKDTFEHKTSLKEPWYDHQATQERHFAVCPACNNSIQVIQLYHEAQLPYARHNLNASVGHQNRQTLLYCPYYSGRPTLAINSRRQQDDPVSDEIKQSLIDNFDKIIYFIKKTIGIRLSSRGQQEMLENYKNSRGWLYSGANLINIPWIFLYQGRARTLAGQGIIKDDIQKALIAWNKNITFDKYNKIIFPEGEYLDLNISFFNHKQNIAGETLDESITMTITGNHSTTIYSETIQFDHRYFLRLSQSQNEQYRSPAQIALAASILE